MLVDKFNLRAREHFNVRTAYRRSDMSYCIFYNEKTGKCKNDKCNEKRKDKDGTCLIKGAVTWTKVSTHGSL